MARNKIPGGLLKPADYVIPRFALTAENGTTLEDLMKPDAWQNYSDKLTVGTEVIALSPDMSLDVSLRVLSVDRLRCNMRVLHVNAAPDDGDFAGEVSQKIDGLSVKSGGRNGGWNVVSSGEILERFGTKAEAVARLEALENG